MALTKITGNSIQDGTVIAADIADGTVTGSKIGVNSVSGNNIGIRAISANNFAAGVITSNVLASNLNISISRTSESANLNVLAIGGNVNLDVVNSAIHFFDANTTANVTFNIRGNTQNTFDAVTTIGQSTSVVAIVKHGTERHTANVYVDGVLQTPFYAANTRPGWKTISNQELNIFAYSIIKTAANQYTVVASNTLFGMS